MKVDLLQFYDKMKDKKLGYTTEEYLFMFNVDFLHLLSIMWSKSERKATDSYKTFLTGECVKNFICACITSILDVNVINNNINEVIENLSQEIKPANINDYITAFNAEEEVGKSDSLFRLAFACHLYDMLVGGSWTDIIDSQKFD